MRFMVKKKRQPPAVIIVALIDILIVLLIFLLVTTTFRDQPAVKLVLPTSKEKPKPGAMETGLIVTITKEPPFLYLGKRPVMEDKLQAELNAAVQRNPQVSLAIRADTDAPFGQFWKVRDAAAVANFKDVSIFIDKEIKP